MHEALRETFTTAINGIVADIRQEKASRRKTANQIFSELEQQYLERRFYSLGKACLTDIKSTFRPSHEVERQWQEAIANFGKYQLPQQVTYLRNFSEGMGIFEDFSDSFYRPSLERIKSDSVLNQMGNIRYFTPPAELFAFSIEIISQTSSIDGLQVAIGTRKDLMGTIDLSTVFALTAQWLTENLNKNPAGSPLDNH